MQLKRFPKVSILVIKVENILPFSYIVIEFQLYLFFRHRKIHISKTATGMQDGAVNKIINLTL